MLNQFAKISPIVDENGYLLSLNKNGEYDKTEKRLKENEIGICIGNNSLITMHNGSPVKLGGDSIANIKNIETIKLEENTQYNNDFILNNTYDTKYIISRIDIQFGEDESEGEYTYYKGTDEFSYCKICIYTNISNENERYVIDTDNTGMNSNVINKEFNGLLYIRLLPNHLDDSEIDYTERITKFKGKPITITITYDQEG